MPPEPEPAPESEPAGLGALITKEGWAYKSNAGKKDKQSGKDKDRNEKWQQRYFIMSNQPLPNVKYYKSDKAAKAGKAPTGEIPLVNAFATVEPDKDHKGEYLLHIQQADRHLKLRFSDPTAVEEWKQAVIAIGVTEEAATVSTTIAAHVRGRKARKEIATQKESSIVIAKHVRGRQARAVAEKVKNRQCLENFKPTSPLDVKTIDCITAKRAREARDRGIAEKAAARGKGEAPAPPPNFLEIDYQALSELYTLVETAHAKLCQGGGSTMSMDGLSSLLKDLGLDDFNSNDKHIARIYQLKDEPANMNFYTDRAKSKLGNLDSWSEGEMTRFMNDNGIALGDAEGDLVKLKDRIQVDERLSKEMQVHDVMGFLYVALSDRAIDFSKFESLKVQEAFDSALQAFNACDPEADGAVVLAELKRVMEADKAGALAEAMDDTNGDGFVSFAEFCAGTSKWYKSVYG